MQRHTQEAPQGARSRTPLDPREEVQDFLDRFARAVTRGDTRAIVPLWETPAFVIGDQEVRTVGSTEEIEQFFGGAKEQYNAQGITDTRAEIVRLDWLSPRLALVEVRWPYIEPDGGEAGYETSSYVLRRDPRNQLRLRVAVMHGSSAGMH